MRTRLPARTRRRLLSATAQTGCPCLFAFGIFALALSFFTGTTHAQTASPTNLAQHFNVQRYEVSAAVPLTNNVLDKLFLTHTGSSVGLEEILRAASDVQAAYVVQGHPGMSVAFATDRITNGLVTLNVFQGVRPQILVSGWPYTNAIPPSAPGKTNEVVHFVLTGYEVEGNTLLSDETLNSILSNHVGTNATFEDIVGAMKDLQLEYRTRRYPTVEVTFPQGQHLSMTNAIVKLQVFEGTLAQINVMGNRYFSSNNVMAALPSLRTNAILNDALFQAELDRANANQDRQIYPKIDPGPEPNTSALRLDVRDRLPLHGKVDFNNQSSPGTPEFRINTSAVYNNLWQKEHSLGAQYSFSPTDYKTGNQWNFYDQPLIANYSMFYRMPWGTPESVAETVAARPGSFGYDEGTRRFNLPPASGGPELTFYASRSTIDTGIENLNSQIIQDIPGVLSISREDVQQDLTVNNGLGFRFREPLPEMGGITSAFSFGADYKTYDLKSFKTNNFFFSIITIDAAGRPNPPVTSTVASPVPVTHRAVSYFPVSLGWDATSHDGSNNTSQLSLGYAGDFLGSTEQREAKFQNVAGSTQADGQYHILTASLTRDQYLYKNWRLALRADGQWASQPLISNEQYGVGGIAGVRGYREGEVFGDTGWRVTSELKTPEHFVGRTGGGMALRLRGSLFMDYANVYLLDPSGRDARTALWGTGVGVAAVLGSSFETRFQFGIPLISTTTSTAGEVRIDFSISGQF